ncbi:hypothetical protein ACWDV4_05225 [Micromonospora sp. NPDC003197]
MTRSIRGARRAAVLLAGTAATALLMSGCGAGQIAETANKAPSIDGINAQTADGTFKVRNLTVSYLDPKGYPAGGDAPIQVVLYNDSPKPVTVKVTTDSGNLVVLADGAAPASPSVTPVEPTPTGSAAPDGSATPSGSASATPPEATTPPAAPAEEPATIEIAANSYAVLNRTTGRHLQIKGLKSALTPGQQINLVFSVDGKELRTVAPVAVPLTPNPAATPLEHEEGNGHG